ncbi:MAG TPA: hypothetical protein VKU00_31600, partial [Chthonomonadaceae bacterium]|nr:hypothetical protein [Chthonomonadaceae bacterium]
GTLLTLDTANPLGKGGEAGVYKVVGQPQLAAKVYAQDKDLTQRIAKLQSMLQHPPQLSNHTPNHVPLAWPIDLLAPNNNPKQPVGFLMPRVHSASQIIDFYNPLTRLERFPLFDYRYLLRTGRNLAATVRALHARDYVLGDLKHSNVLVTPTALVSLVDTDSMQVRDPQTGAVFVCPVHTPDFTPPELQHGQALGTALTADQDNFGLGVMLFQLLMEGTHPFAGVYSGEEDPPALEERIARGHFPYGTRVVPCRPGTRNAPPFALLSPELQALFVACFEEGHAKAERRPDAQSWQAALEEAGRGLVRCEANTQHFYGGHLSECPWCERKRVQLRGLDPFPSEQAVREHKHLPKPPPTRPEPTLKLPIIPTPPPGSNVPAPYGAQTQTPLISRVVVALLSLVFGICGLLGVVAIGSAVFGGCHVYSNYEDYSSPPQVQERAQAIAWSPDGNTFYGGDKTLYAYDTPTGYTKGTFRGHSDVVHGMSLSKDGKVMASYSGNAVNIWDVDSTNCLHTLTFPQPIDAMALSSDGKTLVVGTEDHVLSLWNVPTEHSSGQLDCGGYTLSSLCISPNGAYLAACGNLGMESIVKLWSIADKKNIWTVRDTKSVYALAFAPDSKWLACGGEELRLIHLGDNHKPLSTYPTESSCQALAFSPDGKELALAEFNRLEVWDVSTHSRAPFFTTTTANFQAVAYSPDGKTLLTGSNERGLERYNAQTGELLVTSPMPNTPKE